MGLHVQICSSFADAVTNMPMPVLPSLCASDLQQSWTSLSSLQFSSPLPGNIRGLHFYVFASWIRFSRVWEGGGRLFSAVKIRVLNTCQIVYHIYVLFFITLFG